MNAYDLLIVHSVVVTAADTGHYDIAVKEEKIILLAPTGSLKKAKATRIIDAEGGYVKKYAPPSAAALRPLITLAPQSKADASLLWLLDDTDTEAKEICYTGYSFALLVGNPTPLALSAFAALRAQCISSLKIYKTYQALQLRDSKILDLLLEPPNKA